MWRVIILNFIYEETSLFLLNISNCFLFATKNVNDALIKCKHFSALRLFSTLTSSVDNCV